jgi:hypothetical protein
MLAWLKEEDGGVGTHIITDVVLVNIAAALTTSESDGVGLLSSMRVVMQKAYGESVDGLTYDKSGTDTVKALGKQIKPKQPKYTQAVDIKGMLQVIQRRRQSVKHLPDTSPKRTQELRDCALCLVRLHSLARTDDMVKFNALSEQSFRVYNGRDGAQIRHESMAHTLEECVESQGYIEMNYYRPKGSEFAVALWSTNTEVHTVRPEMIVNADVAWLRTVESVSLLCPIRAMRDYFRCIEARDMRSKMLTTVDGGFWSFTKAGGSNIKGEFQPLKHNTVRNLVLKIAREAGLPVGTNEKGGCTETEEKLAAHFLRGHAGSLSHELTSLEGATWSSSLHLDRARHSARTFHSNYSRGLVQRVRQAFRVHPRKSQLRFEEALLL